MRTQGVVIAPWEEGGYRAYIQGNPSLFGVGETEEEAEANLLALMESRAAATGDFGSLGSNEDLIEAQSDA